MKKTILISGGSDGLGKAMAERFSKKYDVVILCHNKEKTEKAAKEAKCDFVVADVTDYGQIESAVNQVIEKYGQIDYLINNAGVWIEGLLETNKPEDITKAINVNSLGVILLTRSVLPHMKKVGRGRIINVVSQAGLYAKSERSVYNASKWAITGFTKCLAEELKGDGITVCGLYPGSFKSGLFEKANSNKDLSRAMELSAVVRAAEFIVETPDDLNVPELGIKPSYY